MLDYNLLLAEDDPEDPNGAANLRRKRCCLAVSIRILAVVEAAALITFLFDIHNFVPEDILKFELEEYDPMNSVVDIVMLAALKCAVLLFHCNSTLSRLVRIRTFTYVGLSYRDVGWVMGNQRAATCLLKNQCLLVKEVRLSHS